MPMSDARKTRGVLERMSSVTPDFGALMRQKNLGLVIARIGFGEDPYASHVEATRQMLAACSKQTIREGSKSLLALDFTGQLPDIRMPTLVVVGTHDAVTPAPDSRRIAELVPGVELVEYEGAGHMLMYERTTEVDALIVDFARRCLSGEAAAGSSHVGVTVVPRAAAAS